MSCFLYIYIKKYVYLDSNVEEVMWHLSFSVEPVSLSMKPLLQTSFFCLLAEGYSTVCIYHSFFVHSPISWHLGCFHVLAVVGDASGNMECRYLSGYVLWFSSERCPEGALLDGIFFIWIITLMYIPKSGITKSRVWMLWFLLQIASLHFRKIGTKYRVFSNVYGFSRQNLMWQFSKSVLFIFITLILALHSYSDLSLIIIQAEHFFMFVYY